VTWASCTHSVCPWAGVLSLASCGVMILLELPWLLLIIITVIVITTSITATATSTLTSKVFHFDVSVCTYSSTSPRLATSLGILSDPHFAQRIPCNYAYTNITIIVVIDKSTMSISLFFPLFRYHAHIHIHHTSKRKPTPTPTNRLDHVFDWCAFCSWC
jgi:hypothetical protein